MRNGLRACLALAGDVTEGTRERARGAARALAAQAGQVGALAEDVVQQGRANREAIAALVKFEVDRGLSRVGLAGSDEVADLTVRVRALEAAVRELSTRLPAPEAGATTDRPAPATDPAAADGEGEP